MSDSDNSRRGTFSKSGAAQFLSKHYNRVSRRKVKRDLHDGYDPVSVQHRHRALWDAF